MKRRIRGGMFAAAMAAALGFGGAQAFAAPAATESRACTSTQCDADCKRRGYDGGICAGSWGCACWIQ